MSHQTIATEHYDIRIVPPQEFTAKVVVPVCESCGHGICPGCGNWCDNLLGKELDLCCEGHCTPGAATTTVKVSAGSPELLQTWQNLAADLLAKTKFT